MCFSNVHAVDGDDMTSLHYISKSKAALAVAVMQALLTAGPNIGNVQKILYLLIILYILVYVAKHFSQLNVHHNY